jgi:DsbC/DsbD-like thiol-disulfide interchange protein
VIGDWGSFKTMKRRTLLLSALVGALVPPALAANPPWRARLLKGGFDGKNWWAGLHVSLDADWKTYWRVPGEGGIAPQIDLPGENIAKAEIFHPLPHRYEDEAGITIGYKHEVVFPLALAPLDPAKASALSLKAFFGVCDVVCIPAQFAADAQFDPAGADAPDQALIARWQRFVPVPTVDGPIAKATAREMNGTIVIDCDMRKKADDFFVEGNPAHYFGKPTLMRGIALLPVSGAKSLEDLRGTELRVTMDVRGRGLEQRVTVV